MKIIDSFIFYNEVDLLLYRLSILNEFVYKFIIVESHYTFSGKEKPLFYEINKEKFEQFKDKIIHIVVDIPYKYPQINYHHNQQWQNEYYQRNSIKLGVDQIINTLEEEDIIITSDLDEIPDPRMLDKILKGELEYDKTYLNKVGLDMYYYNLNTRLGEQVWNGVKLLNIKTYKRIGLSFQDMRTWEHSYNVPLIKNGGWHLSYFGDTDFIIKKVDSYAHQEYNNDKYINKEILETKIKNGINFIDGMEPQFIKIKDNPNLPLQYEKYLTKYIVE